MEHRHTRIGVAYVLIAWLLFTLMTLLSRFAMAKVSVATVLLFQNLIGLATVIPWLSMHGWPLARTEKFGLLLLRTLVSLVAIGLSFLAVQKTSLVDTMLLSNTSPLWIPFVVLIWRKIPINHFLWPGVIGGFIGIFLVLQPDRGIFQTGAFLALGAGILQSVNMVALRVLSYTERNHTVLFYYFLIASLLCLPLSIYTWVQPGLTEWMLMLAIGVLFSLGQWAFVRAFHHAKASQIGPFAYSAVVYAVLLDWMLYGHMPGLLVWIGIFLVCWSGIWAIRFSRPIS